MLLETEPDGCREAARVVTIFLINRECPWRCTMCDLWKHTFPEATPSGWVSSQVHEALNRPEVVEWISTSPAECWVKLYNAGSFFDPRAIPLADQETIAREVRHFDRVVVECHPRLVGAGVIKFKTLLKSGFSPPLPAQPSNTTPNAERSGPRLELALGLETVEPHVLNRLNKGFEVRDFDRAADWIKQQDLDLRAFLLVQPPFMDAAMTRKWTLRSVRHAVEQGARVVTLIPTRAGNGAMESLAAQGLFTPPSLPLLETCLSDALNQTFRPAVILSDLWNLDEFSRCHHCLEARRQHLENMNRTQRTSAPVLCPKCDASADFPRE
ncbi:MAG: hypothetical protein FJ404_10000 [Verrucomicrobia bacterium]|nr:hypothetical protein [Verrucomicrobiota bacterium]